MKGERARVPKLNLIESTGIAISFVGALLLLMTVVFSNPLGIGAVALGIGILLMGALETDTITDDSVTESLLFNLALSTVFVGLMGVINGVGISIGLMEATETQMQNGLFLSAGTIIGGLAITAIGSVAKEIR